MTLTIALESTATTIVTTATRGLRDDQCVGVKKERLVEARVGEDVDV